MLNRLLCMHNITCVDSFPIIIRRLFFDNVKIDSNKVFKYILKY